MLEARGNSLLFLVHAQDNGADGLSLLSTSRGWADLFWSNERSWDVQQRPSIAFFGFSDERAPRSVRLGPCPRPTEPAGFYCSARPVFPRVSPDLLHAQRDFLLGPCFDYRTLTFTLLPLRQHLRRVSDPLVHENSGNVHQPFDAFFKRLQNARRNLELMLATSAREPKPKGGGVIALEFSHGGLPSA